MLRSKAMTRNVNVFVAARAHFIYKIIYIKKDKMRIENGYKMPKKGPNKLKLGPNVYFYVFYGFPNDF